MRTVLAGVLAFILMSQTAATQQAERFPDTCIDYLGFVSWEDVKLTQGAATGRRLLLKKDYPGAEAAFRKAFLANHQDFPALSGLVLAGRARKRLPVLLTQFHQLQAEHRKKSGQFDKGLLFASFYTGAVAFHQATREHVPGAQPPDSSSSWLYFRDARRVLTVKTFSDTNYAIMYVGALNALQDIAAVRRSSRLALQKYPRFHALKLTYARSFTTGVEAQTQGGKDVPVGPDERLDLGKWRTLAVEVATAAPDYPPAAYEAGMALAATDRKRAVAFLRRFLRSEPAGTRRHKAAAETLSRLGG